MYCIIDVETTGGSERKEKLTEIAILKFDGTQHIDTFHSLINPERPIPYYITQVTGINDSMVANAPKFYEIAKQIVEFTTDCIFVAHNVKFDYNFVRSEFSALGFEYKRKQLCTVELTRKLYPGLKSYGLANLCKEFSISLPQHHRALIDATATLDLLKILLNSDANNTIQKAIKTNVDIYALYSNLNRTEIDALPNTPGVYFFYNNKNELIYIGKSVEIKKRVLSHFSNKSAKKTIEMCKNIAHIDFEETGSELCALLHESNLIKQHKPIYNTALKRTYFSYGIYYKYSLFGYLEFYIQKVTTEQPLMAFSSKIAAKSALENWCNEYGLCKQVNGLFSNSGGPCFDYMIQQCNGACVQEEDSNLYNQRAQKALQKFQLSTPNFYLVGPGRTPSEQTIVQVENNVYKGWGFLNTESNQLSLNELSEVITPSQHNKDAFAIIRSFAQGKKRNYKVLPYFTE